MFCPEGKSQALYWDLAVMGLGLRVTPNGVQTFVFQSRLGDQTIRISIGRRDSWGIEEARVRAREFKRDIDTGIDPRLKVKDQIKESNKRARKKRTLMSWWNKYLEARIPYWSVNHYRDHLVSSRPASESRSNRDGCLVELLQFAPTDITTDVIRQWALNNSDRQSSLRLAFRQFKSFINWINEEYEDMDLNIKSLDSKRHHEFMGTPSKRMDCLQKEQLKDWFNGVEQISNETMSNYLQVLLLTGARREEIANLKWSDIDFRWKKMTIKDKATKGFREIPLTNYVESLISQQELFNEYVFFSRTSKSGRLVNPLKKHTQITQDLDIKLTLHGLRRSFRTLSEWTEMPLGIASQIQGHKPSATVEKHYARRSIDLLRLYHQKFEDWILEQAEVSYEYVG